MPQGILGSTTWDFWEPRGEQILAGETEEACTVEGIGQIQRVVKSEEEQWEGTDLSKVLETEMSGPWVRNWTVSEWTVSEQRAVERGSGDFGPELEVTSFWGCWASEPHFPT